MSASCSSYKADLKFCVFCGADIDADSDDIDDHYYEHPRFGTVCSDCTDGLIFERGEDR